MTAETKNTENTKVTETNASDNTPVMVRMKKLTEGVSIIFQGVVTVLESMEPGSAAEGLVEDAFQKNGMTVPWEKEAFPTTDNAATDQANTAATMAVTAQVDTPKEQEQVETETPATQPVAEESKPTQPAEEPKEEPKKPAEKPATSITADDIAKVIVQKLKAKRSNNEVIGSLLKAYGADKVSELDPTKYEAFLTDIADI